MKFLIQNPILNALSPAYTTAVKIVKSAIAEKRPILIRHNADCDGYGGAIAMERAILPLIEKEHGDKRALNTHYRRLPQKAPFYEYLDVIRDLNTVTYDGSRFRNLPPLVLVIDNGSTEQDVLALSLLKAYGCRILIIDHHPPKTITNGKTAVDAYADAHINPHLVGGDSSLTAGMLATECALQLAPTTKHIDYIPALTGFSDHMEGPIRDQYFAIAKKAGYTEQSLLDLAMCIDYQVVFLGTQESRYLVDDIFGKEKQSLWVESILPIVQERHAQQLISVKHFIQLSGDSVVTAHVDMNKVTARGTYPATGKTAGIAIDWLRSEGKKAVVVAHGPNFITLRTNVEGFDVNTLVKTLIECHPYAQIEGGGHAVAGSIRFLEGAKDVVLKAVDAYILTLPRE